MVVVMVVVVSMIVVAALLRAATSARFMVVFIMINLLYASKNTLNANQSLSLTKYCFLAYFISKVYQTYLEQTLRTVKREDSNLCT